MNRHENPAYTPGKSVRIQSQLETQLENLWRTGEIHVTRPTIEAELQNALYYLREVFRKPSPGPTPICARLGKAQGSIRPPSTPSLPCCVSAPGSGAIAMAIPLSPPKSAATPCRPCGKTPCRVQRRGLEALAHHLPLSSLFQATPPQLASLTGSLTASLRDEPHIDTTYILERNKEEPWRVALFLMRAKLALALEKPASPAAYVHPGGTPGRPRYPRANLARCRGPRGGGRANRPAAPHVDGLWFPFRRS